MNRIAIWIIYIWLWWTVNNKPDAVLRRFARGYWARVDWLIRFGVFATVGLLTLALLFSLDDSCTVMDGKETCEMRLTSFLDAPANEVGDTLAGLAGGLAFLWIVITVLLQGKELAAQRQELALTRMEMVEQRKATQDMARSMQAQALVREREGQQLHEQSAKELFDQLLSSFLKFCETRSIGTWEYLETRVGMGGSKGSLSPVGYRNSGSLSVDRSMQVIRQEIVSSISQIVDFHERGLIVEYPEKDADMDQALSMLCELETLWAQLSAAQQSRFDSLGIREMKVALSNLEGEKGLWFEPVEASK